MLAGLSTGYWLGGAIADRWPQPRLLVALLGAGALLVLAIPFVDGWMLDQVVAWDPGPRLNPLIATILLFGVPSVVLGTISPVAVRLKAQSLEHLGRTAGRLFAVSTAGSIAGTFLTAFWLIPEFGTDQVLALGRRRADARRGRGGARREAGRRARGRARTRRCEPRRRRLARAGIGRDRGGLAAAQLVAGVSPAGPGRPDRRHRGLTERLQGHPHQGLPVPPDRRRRGRHHPLSPLRQLVPERHVRRRSVQDPLRVLRLSAAPVCVQAVHEARALHRAGRRLRAQAHLARLPERAGRRRRDRPGGRRRRLRVLRAAARPSLEGRGRGRPALPRPERRALGRDRRSTPSTPTRSRSTSRRESSSSSHARGSLPAA